MEKGPKCAHPSADNQQPLAGRETAGPGRAEPSRAQPILVGADRAPHRTGLHYLQLHLPAITRTLKEEEDVACQCASCSLVSEQRRSAFSAALPVPALSQPPRLLQSSSLWPAALSDLSRLQLSRKEVFRNSLAFTGTSCMLQMPMRFKFASRIGMKLYWQKVTWQ
ncbi:hypothetical protein VZT92_016035 [Zoarces viviparus]|uniref:Uncharacterized protein n=1 Tax=Zoarces viviparus TaxID=48416 RepID=A0AAW1ERT8_ZOAVI